MDRSTKNHQKTGDINNTLLHTSVMGLDILSFIWDECLSRSESESESGIGHEHLDPTNHLTHS